MWNLIVTLSGILSVVVLSISYIPQIVTLYRTKNAEGISPSFWYILDLSLLMLFILAIDASLKTGEVGLMVAQGLNLVLALIVTGQVVIYKKK